MTSTHPVATLRDLIFAGSNPAASALLKTPGLELTYSARGAIFKACREIAKQGKKEILVPAFHCPSGITPILEAGLRPVFYRVCTDLTIDYEDLYSKSGPDTGAVLVIHFFGFETDLRPLTTLRTHGIAIIEDWSHSFVQCSPLRLSGTDSEYRVYSFWKLVPSGIGGGLLRSNSVSSDSSSPSCAPPLFDQIVQIKRLFEEALEHSEHRTARSVFRVLERIRIGLKRTQPTTVQDAAEDIPGESYYSFEPRLADSTMPNVARKLIEGSKLDTIIARRRDNYRRYAQLLQDKDPLRILIPQLPAQACPWVFPVLLDGRDYIDHCWRDAGVALHTFGIHLHSALFSTGDKHTIADAKFLAEHLLCLAIHQDIQLEEIDRSAGLINTTLAYED